MLLSLLHDIAFQYALYAPFAIVSEIILSYSTLGENMQCTLNYFSVLEK